MKNPLHNLTVIFVSLFWLSCEFDHYQKSNDTQIQIENANLPNENWKIDRQTKITYSKHAKCRMGCRHIDGEEIREILLMHNINRSKTKVSHQGESRAYEGTTHDGQLVRVVAAEKSPGHIHIVTVIDLKNDWDCECK